MNQPKSFKVINLTIEVTKGNIFFFDNVACPPIFALSCDESHKLCAKVTFKNLIESGGIEFGNRRSLKVKVVQTVFGVPTRVYIHFDNGTHEGNGVIIGVRTLGKMLAFLKKA